MKTPSENVKCEHTPTPWYGGHAQVIQEATGKTICIIPGARCDETQPDTAFIVTACNAHEVLLDACKCALNSLDAIGATTGSPLVHQLRRAISQATTT